MGVNKTRLIVINGNITAQTYINDVLAVNALPFIQFHGPNVTFMQDNACPHSASTTRQFLDTNNVNVLDWPVNSPKLNPIEQVWDKLGCHVRRNHAVHTIKTLQLPYKQSGHIYLCRLYSITLTVCAAIPQHALHKMVDTWDTDTFHWIFSLCLLIDTPPNGFKPVLLCNCVSQNKVWFWKFTPMWYHSIFFNERIITVISNFRGMSKNVSLLQLREIVRIYASSKYLDRNVRLVLLILAEYIIHLNFLLLFSFYSQHQKRKLLKMWESPFPTMFSPHSKTKFNIWVTFISLCPSLNI